MSGLQVVRTVTVQEKIAICETQIALLSAAVESLFDYLETHAIKDEKLEKKLRIKLQHYRELATPDKYNKLPEMIQRELDYISSERDRLKNNQLQQAKFRQSKLRNLSESIKTLQMLASGSGTEVAPDILLKHSELYNKNEAELSVIQQKIAAELSLLSNRHQKEQVETKLTDEQKDIRNRLISTEDELLVSEWKLISAEFDKGDERSNRIDRIMAELEEIDFPESKKKQYQKQLERIYEETSDQQRALRLDSLIIELADKSRDYHKLQKTRHDLLMIKSQLDILQEENATRLSLQIEKALESENISVLENMLKAAKEKLKSIITGRSVEQGRGALIEALQSLGYTVNEEMKTAVVENGHLVVKKPAEEVYGIELQTVAATGKFQLRVVSGLPDNERSTTDDVAQEEKWCDDLAKLQQSLAGSDVELDLEKNLDPGTVAVKHSPIMTKMLERENRTVSTKGVNWINKVLRL